MAMQPAPLSVHLDATGELWLGGRKVPNSGIEVHKVPGEVMEMTVRLPVFDLTLDSQVGPVRVLFVAALGEGAEVIQGEGESLLDALHSLAEKVEGRL